MKRLVYGVVDISKGLLIMEQQGKDEKEILSKLKKDYGEDFIEEYTLALQGANQCVCENENTFLGSYYGDDTKSTKREIFFDIVSWDREEKKTEDKLIIKEYQEQLEKEAENHNKEGCRILERLLINKHKKMLNIIDIKLDTWKDGTLLKVNYKVKEEKIIDIVESMLDCEEDKVYKKENGKYYFKYNEDEEFDMEDMEDFINYNVFNAKLDIKEILSS